MSLIRDFIDKLRRKRAVTGPIIQTAWGPVTEYARRQAALNMNADPALRARVFEIIQKEVGGDFHAALAEFRRRYPEVKW